MCVIVFRVLTRCSAREKPCLSSSKLFSLLKGEKMRSEVILMKDEMRSEITKYYEYPTLFIYFKKLDL